MLDKCFSEKQVSEDSEKTICKALNAYRMGNFTVRYPNNTPCMVDKK